MNISKLSKNSRKLIGVALSALMLSSAAHAADAVLDNQVPGFYRYSHGQNMITALYDGYVDLDPKSLSGLSQTEIQALIANMFQAKNSAIQTAVNAFLIHTEAGLVLVDAGSSDCFGPTMGYLPASIKASGYKPEDVDVVLLTHMHPDHMCGITAPDSTAVFPNAIIWASENDANFWLNPNSVDTLPKNQQVFFTMAQKAAEPYLKKGRFKTFKDGDIIVKGIKGMPSAGHTPGHTSYLVSEGKEELLVLGDLVHFHAVQLPDPNVTIELDVNPAGAIESRKRMLALAAAKRWTVAAAHFPFPGLGHIRAEKKGYSWVPVEYSSSVKQPRSEAK